MLAPLFWHRCGNPFQLSRFWFSDVSLIFLSGTGLIYGTSPSGITLKSFSNIKWWFFKVLACKNAQAVFWTCGCRGIRIGCCSIQLAGGRRSMLTPHHEISFFLSYLTPNLSYITYNHKPSKYQGKMSIYGVKNKGLTWRIGHLSVHYKRFKDSDVIRWPLKELRYIWKIMTRKYMMM